MSRDIKGRAASFNPPNRFERFHLELQEEPDEERSVRTEFFLDSSRSILAENESLDVPFKFSINPYRGCEHGCIYCYARPSHEFLGFSAGLDFESKILVKEDAPVLLEQSFRSKSWKPQIVALSGNTDPYQPAERKLELTRRCLEVFLKYRNPVSVITKNSLVTRDLDILKELAKLNLVHVHLSITTLDGDLARVMEPRTSAPARRLEALSVLCGNEIPAGVNVSPVIPGLTDEEIPSILREVAARGAVSAGYILVRLPGAVEPLFLEWIQRALPLRAAKIVGRLKEVRRGRMSDSRFGSRMSGEGKLADSLRDLFLLSCRRYGLNEKEIQLSVDQFKIPHMDQLNLF